MIKRRVTSFLVASLAWLFPITALMAAEYPLRPIHVVVGYPPAD